MFVFNCRKIWTQRVVAILEERHKVNATQIAPFYIATRNRTIHIDTNSILNDNHPHDVIVSWNNTMRSWENNYRRVTHNPNAVAKVIAALEI